MSQPKRRLPDRTRGGIALLEALVALVLVATAVAAGVSLAAESTAAVGRVQRRDADVRRASAFLDAVALWSRGDLDRHLGDRAEGAWTLRVERPVPTLYVVTLAERADTAASAAPAVLLATALYRPVAR